MSHITHSLVGYDRFSERAEEEIDVPDTVLPRAKELARVPPDDPDAIMCYALDASGARDLADMLRARIDTGQRDYFLEGFEDAETAYEFAADAEFRPDPPGWSVWVHNDPKKDRIKVTIARAILDDYASSHGHRDGRAVVDLLNSRIRKHAQKMINIAIGAGRAGAGHLELNAHDLARAFDE